jgi:hypothetical protein
MQSSPGHRLGEHPSADPAARAVAAVGLAAIALIHVVDLPDTITGSTLVGWEYIALIAACVLVAAGLLSRPDPRQWVATGAIAASALVAYTLSRTTGIPGDSVDIGNWECPLGIAALTVEAFTVTLAGGVLSNVVAWQRLPARARVLGARVPAGIVEATSQSGLEAAP